MGLLAIDFLHEERKSGHYLPTGKVKTIKVKGFSMQYNAQM